MNSPTLETRKSFIEYDRPFFWTATIHNWQHLLLTDDMKMEVINSLRFLVHKSLASIYAYVIMPSHIHLIWTIHGANGKESPHGSFLKFTAHQFKRLLIASDPELLELYRVDASNKQYEFWQRDSLAIPIFTRRFLLQKIAYIHHNPVAKRWRLVPSFEKYRFSSAPFYETGLDEFGILTHVSEIY